MSAKKISVVISPALDTTDVRFSKRTSTFEGFRRQWERARAEAWRADAGEELFPREELFVVQVEYDPRPDEFGPVVAHLVHGGGEILACVYDAVERLTTYTGHYPYADLPHDVESLVEAARRERDAEVVAA